MMNLRYRYLVWLDRKLSRYFNIIDDTPESLREFTPQKAYTFTDQFFMVGCGWFIAIVAYGKQAWSYIQIKTDRIGEKLTVKQPDELGDKKE